MIVIIYPPRAKPANTPLQIIHRDFAGRGATLAWKAVRGGETFGQYVPVPHDMTQAEVVSSINAILSQAHETIGHIDEHDDVRRTVVVKDVKRIEKTGDRVFVDRGAGQTMTIYYECGFVECLAD